MKGLQLLHALSDGHRGPGHIAISEQFLDGQTIIGLVNFFQREGENGALTIDWTEADGNPRNTRFTASAWSAAMGEDHTALILTRIGKDPNVFDKPPPKACRYVFTNNDSLLLAHAGP